MTALLLKAVLSKPEWSAHIQGKHKLITLRREVQGFAMLLNEIC